MKTEKDRLIKLLELCREYADASAKEVIYPNNKAISAKVNRTLDSIATLAGEMGVEIRQNGAGAWFSTQKTEGV